MDIDEWTANACRIEVENGWITAWRGGGSSDLGEWNYKDPRCRQIIREHFKLATEPWNEACPWLCSTTTPKPVEACGETLEAAELACIEAIYATEDR